MRFIHFADLHIDQTDKRLPDYTSLLGDVLEAVREHVPDFVLFAGDAYHTHTPRQEVKTIFHNHILDMAAICPVFMVVGNHDRTRRHTARDALYEFTSLNVPNVYVFHDLGTVDMGDYTITGIPWQYHRECVLPPLGNGMNVALVHASFIGASMGGVKVTTLGHEFTLSPADVAHYDYVAAGHIHKPQQLGNIIYPGSVGLHDWGEASDEVHYYILHEDGVVTWVPYWDRDRYDLSVEDAEIIEPDVEAMYRITVPHDYNTDILFKKFGGTFELAIRKLPDPTVRVRVPALVFGNVPDITKKEMQLRQYLDSISEEDAEWLMENFIEVYREVHT